MNSADFSGTSGFSRQEQMALVTDEIELPVQPLNARHMRVIAETMADVWRELMRKTDKRLVANDEAEINALMAIQLDNARNTNPRLNQLVRSVSRGEETPSFDGSSIEKRPDLTIRLSDEKHPFPLVVECKLLDHPAQKTVHLYCQEGLARFLNGDYAWARREAFMMAYVRDQSSIVGKLCPHLEKHAKTTPDPFATELLPKQVTGIDLELSRSRHGRSFHYPDRDPNLPGSIELWHLWLYPE